MLDETCLAFDESDDECKAHALAVEWFDYMQDLKLNNVPKRMALLAILGKYLIQSETIQQSILLRATEMLNEKIELHGELLVMFNDFGKN